MSEAQDAAAAPGPALPDFRDEEGHVSAAFSGLVSAMVAAGLAAELAELIADFHEADIADLILALPEDERARFVALLGDGFDYAALTELDEGVRLAILEALPPETVARGIGELDSDDAVYILEDLDEAFKAAILARIPVVDRIALQRSLDYPEDSAGRLMQTDFIAVPPFWSVGQTIDYMRDSDELPDTFHELFVIDPSYRLAGTVPLDRLLRAKRPVKIEALVEDVPQTVRVTEDQEEVARLFQRYNLVSVAVVDDSDRLVGIITIDDIVDVIQEEAGEDLRLLAGVGDEEISDTVAATARSRFPWLFINMFTAFLAASVIGLFDATIEQMVALAVLMPIVASIGGNAGTQAMTVAVRALAARELSGRNARRVLRREVTVGLMNGLALSLVVGSFAGFWFSSVELGVVIGTALVVNLVTAGLFGTLIPITLHRLKADPAVSSAVFLTTVTDVVGFFAFLGLAAWWFGLW